MPSKLPRKALLAVTAVANADGLLRKGELEALLRAARECQLEEHDITAVEEAAKTGISLDSVDLSDLSGWDQAVTYALAYWLARVDGVVNAEELQQLRDLESKLSISTFKIRSAGAAVGDVMVLPGGQRPDKYDFGKLLERLEEKLPMLVAEAKGGGGAGNDGDA